MASTPGINESPSVRANLLKKAYHLPQGHQVHKDQFVITLCVLRALVAEIGSSILARLFFLDHDRINPVTGLRVGLRVTHSD
jgi:hypothetical protein